LRFTARIAGRLDATAVVVASNLGLGYVPMAASCALDAELPPAKVHFRLSRSQPYDVIIFGRRYPCETAAARYDTCSGYLAQARSGRPQPN